MSLKPFFIFLTIFIVNGCSYIPFEKKEIENEKIIELIKESDIENKEFTQFLLLQGFTENELPIKNWGLKELIYAQQFFNPKLKTGKIELELIKANEATAKLYPKSSLGIKIGRETTNKELTEKVFGADFSFTFESANKRLIRHELALNESQLALINLHLINWKLRTKLFDKLFDFIESKEILKLSKDELRLKQSILNMTRKKFQAGIASQIDIDTKDMEMNIVNQKVLKLQMDQEIIRNQIASLIGLNTQKFNLIPLDSKKITSILDKMTVSYLKDKKLQELQEISLMQRLDLRKGLANYAIAEAKLKLEVANQYPDYNFTPAYIYEFGTRFWSLGIGAIISSASRNKAFVKKAQKFRDLEASKVITLQLSAINNIEQLQLSFSNKIEELNYSKKMMQTKSKLEKSLFAKFEKGLINRMEYENEKINLININKKHHKAIYNLIRIGLLAEKNLQEPIFTPNLKFINEK